MIDKELLQLLVCPENHEPLHPADEELIGRLNGAIAASRVKNQGGEILREPIEGGLVRQDGSVLYPILDGIPVLLIDRAIALKGIW